MHEIPHYNSYDDFQPKKYIAVQENSAVFRRKTNQSWICMLDCEV